MNATIFVAVIFAVLLGLEWRYRLGSIRVAAASLTLVVLFFAQPLPTRAARRALLMPPAERVTRIRADGRLTEYASGVRTMEQAFADEWDRDAGVRLLSLGFLFWLACAPVLRRAPRPAEGPLDVGSGAENSQVKESTATGAAESLADRSDPQSQSRRAILEPEDVRTREDFAVFVRG